MSYITEWNADEVIAEVSGELAANMETAAQVVETDARSRLLSIGSPDWGAGYRRMLALFRLTSIVHQDDESIVAEVGMPPGKAGYDGFYIETGSTTAPAHPWLRPALLGNLSKIAALLRGR